jgi:hypothetical protein
MTDLQTFLDGVEQSATSDAREAFFREWDRWKWQVLSLRDTHAHTEQIEATHDPGGTFDEEADAAAKELQPQRWTGGGGFGALEAWHDHMIDVVTRAFGRIGDPADDPADITVRPTSISEPPVVPTTEELETLREARGDVQTPKEYAAECMQIVGGIARRHAAFLESDAFARKT